MADPKNITEVLETVEEEVDGKWLSLGQVMDTFKHRGFGPLLLIAALVIVLPTGGIPGIPTIIGVAVIVLAAQMVCGRTAPWLPKKMRAMRLKKSRFDKGADKIKPTTRMIDYIIKQRLTFFTNDLAARVIGLVCIALALLLPFTEFIPFSDIIPGVAIALLGLGLTAKDGVIVIAGLIFAVTAIGLITSWIF